MNKEQSIWDILKKDIIDPLGKSIFLSYNSLFKGFVEGFPKSFNKNEYIELGKPDMEFFINLNSLNSGLDSYLKYPIPIDKKNPNNFIHVQEADIELDKNKNLIILKIKKGIIGLECLLNSSIGIKDATIQIAPKITQKIHLDLMIKIVSLDLEYVPGYFDKAIAQGIDSFLQEKGAIASEDLSKIIKSKILLLDKKSFLETTIEETSLFVSKENGITIQINYKINS